MQETIEDECSYCGNRGPHVVKSRYNNEIIAECRECSYEILTIEPDGG